MKQLIKVIGGVFCLGLMIGVSLSNEPTPSNEQFDPEEVFIQAYKQLDTVKGFHLNMHIIHDMEGKKQTVVLKGKQQNPDMAYLKTTVMNQTIKLYVKGSKMAIQKSTTNKWQLKPQGPEILLLKQMLLAFQYIKDARFIEAAEINKIKCSGVEANLTDEGFAKITNLGRVSGLNKMNFSDASYKMWFDSQSLLPYKINFSAQIAGDLSANKENTDESGESSEAKPDKASNKMTMALTIEILLFDYDKDIEIIFPDEVKELFDDKSFAESDKSLVPETQMIKDPSNPNKAAPARNKISEPTTEDLISKLGSPDWLVRETATKELIKRGLPVISALEAVSTDDAEIRIRIQYIITMIEGSK